MNTRKEIWRLSLAVAALFAPLTVQAYELPEPVTDADYYHDGQPSEALVQLGRNLFFDKIMSGNQNISCATCHNPLMFSTDGLSLGVGEGGAGLGRYRTTGEGSDAIDSRIGRHAPHLYNLGAKEFTRLNWNGIHQVVSGRVTIPAGGETPPNLNNVLAGQALFPIVNLNEMIGDRGENDIADKITRGRGRFGVLWDAYMRRLKGVPEYVEMFVAAFDDVSNVSDVKIQHYANAISAYQAVAFRSDNSPFDAYLRGDVEALTAQQVRGMELFYGDAGCSSCHSGKFQTDHEFHGIAMPQLGPGAEARFPSQDRGRAEATRVDADWAKFRTPSLRNVALTAPYGHTGAFATLKGIVEHHVDPVSSLEQYDTSQAVLPSREDLDTLDFEGYNDLTLRQDVIDAMDISPISLSEEEIADVIAFLHALTDPRVFAQVSEIPDSVASGLPVRD